MGVHVSVDLGINLWWTAESWGPHRHKPLVGQVRVDGALHAGLLIRNVMVSIGRRSGRQSTLASAAVAQPEHDGAYDEQGSSWDPNDKRPGKTGADVAWNHIFFHLGICKQTLPFILGLHNTLK